MKYLEMKLIAGVIFDILTEIDRNEISFRVINVM